MTTAYRIAVYTPHLDGDYFGKLLSTIHRVSQAKGWQLTIIQTQVNHPYDAPGDAPLFIEQMDAAVLILDAVGPNTKRLLAVSGKPVVSIGMTQDDFPCHAVLIDNRGGIRMAVDHLVAHGHRRIACVGAMNQFDQLQRLAGYRAALAAHGIPTDDRLIVHASDNLVQSGIEAADELLSRGVPFTAVVCFTDKNAIGVVTRLRERGLSVPGDIAVTGFDDIEQSSDVIYALSTVRQHYARLAESAALLVERMLGGERPAESIANVPVEFVVRGSCGCNADDANAPADVARYRHQLAELRATLRELESNNARWIQNMVRATAARRVELSEMFADTGHWGFLALWDEHRGGLTIDRGFSARNDALPPPGERFLPAAFPPIEKLPESAQGGGADVVIVHPVKNDRRDWGFVVLAGSLNKLSPMFSSNLAHQSYVMLAATLERETLFAEVQSIAERLEIVSRTTNDGIWDLDLVRNRIHWSSRALAIFGEAAVTITEDPETFIRLIHPEDRSMVLQRINDHLEYRRPYQIEYRLQLADDKTVWVYGTGEAIADDEGKPVRIIGSVTDITTKKEDEERIKRLAYHDVLTGLPNRVLFYERLQSTLQHAKRSGGKAAVMLLDLDRFKITNDTLGHMAGDELLKHAADRLRASVRPDDVIARLGGDEFTVLLSPVQGERELTEIADRLLRSLTEPLEIDGREIATSASIGACLFPEGDDTVEAIIKNADTAMYKAKEEGRDRMVVYTPDMSRSVEKRFSLSNNLRKAVERNEFALHYQPQVDLATGRVFGAEALLRWQSAEHGTVQPSDFIPLAEETGWIVPISVWVVEEACRQIIAWQKTGLQPLTVSVNISAKHFRQNDFSSWMKAVLRETGVDPRLICLEITETTAIQDMEHSVQMLKELVDIGITIAVDDFGTGHSSLMLLRRLPIQYVKIDKSFVMDMTHNSDDAAIVKAVIAMSHSLGLAAIAEGVECEAQRDRLAELGCDHIQGYYIGRPMEARRFEAFMRSRTGSS